MQSKIDAVEIVKSINKNLFYINFTLIFPYYESISLLDRLFWISDKHPPKN